ncbi:MAG: pyroglutamyl-peptidase I [Chloroflexi bacterium]|nr:pyroglutamyl-peptidase I [Ardenticatenaceae bacterium]MBL1128462.1 pyroglutamyl-peptidase I [Chloroflexota bacterium]NOG34539.1 pyroglutamyl-peptidase I [Chloroflexota bacterium]GIK56827.1 MAG: pyrrolidone-carboxylate peptidase [Chloroflexota bacterium]
MKLLLTGFEPFGNSSINPSEKVVHQLAQQEIEGVELLTVILPVERFTGPDTLIRTYISAQPNVVLSLGEAGGVTAVTIERVAANLLDFSISDNGGHLVTDKPIVADGPPAYFATLPTRQMVNALTEISIPAQLSYSAGTFLCNQVMYEMLHYIHKHQLKSLAGFVHLPQLPQQTAGKRPPLPSMSLDVMVAGVTAVIHTITHWYTAI